jgi:hypothetical protein
MTSEEYGELLEAIRQEGQAAGVAHAIAYAESMAKALGEAGEVVRAEEWQDLVRELREGDSGRSLTRLIAEKQAEALEALLQLGCFACAMLMSECGQCKDIRERAAAYRKGGAP